MACGAGWAWLRDGGRVVHVAGARGPRGPLTAIVDRVPVTDPGRRLRLDSSHALTWTTPALPVAAPWSEVAAACEAVRPHCWNDPRAFALTVEDPDASVARLAGRGPGLTPAGDDVLAGFTYALLATGHPAAGQVRTVVRATAEHLGEPSASLVRAACEGEVFAPAAAMLAALVKADGSALAPAVRILARLGGTTGRAMLTGISRALTSPQVSGT